MKEARGPGERTQLIKRFRELRIHECLFANLR